MMEPLTWIVVAVACSAVIVLLAGLGMYASMYSEEEDDEPR